MATDRGIVTLERATLADVDFRLASFAQFATLGGVFLRCDFRGMVFDQRMQGLFASRHQTTFRECRFDETDLRRAAPGQSRFEGCSFVGAKIERWISHCAEFLDCTFSGPMFGTKFYGRPHGALATQLSPQRPTNEFRRNDFSGAELVDTLFVQGIQIADQRWPEREDTIRLDRIHQRLQRGRSEIMRWAPLEARNQALEMVLRLSTVYGEQPELVRKRNDPSLKAPIDVQDKVWELLAKPL